MRDSLASKAARHSVLYNRDCGVCDNCRMVERAKVRYFACKLQERNNLTAARHEYLETMRLFRCTSPIQLSSTGRLTSKPNFQGIPKPLQSEWDLEEAATLFARQMRR